MKFAVFFAFLIFAFGLTIRAFLIKFAKPEDDPERRLKPGYQMPPKLMPGDVIELKPCRQHEWRNITEFSRRCRICGEVEFTENVPDGMSDYIRLMTTRAAKESPLNEAIQYKFVEPRMHGPCCPCCRRVIGGPDDLPRNPFVPERGPVILTSRMFGNCPYCQKPLVFSNGEWNVCSEPNHS